MSLPKVTIRAILFATFVVAFDLAALQLISGSFIPGLVLGFFGTMPMAHVLAVSAFLNLSRRTKPGPSFIGFGLAGTLAILAWFNFSMAVDPERLVSALHGLTQTLLNAHYVKKVEGMITSANYIKAYQFFLVSATIVAATALPQLLLAYAGAWVARRIASARGRATPTVPAST